MELCDHVYTTSNKIRSLCSFAVFHIGICAPEISSLICVICLVTLEFNYSEQKTPKTLKKITPKNEDNSWSKL